MNTKTNSQNKVRVITKERHESKQNDQNTQQNNKKTHQIIII